MSLPGYLHGGTDEIEVSRLITQAQFVASFAFEGFSAAPGMRILDLGTGVGAMAAQLGQHFPGLAITGVDSSEAQLSRARALHPVATYVCADASSLPFTDATFDRVFCTWLLEHVASPLTVIREVFRVLRPGGVFHAVEVDNDSLRAAPPLPELSETFALLNAAQQRAQGDPFIGPKLRLLFDEAGFSDVEVRSIALVGDVRNLQFYRELCEEFAGICESLDETLDPAGAGVAQVAARNLRARPNQPGTSLSYAPVLARGIR